MHISKRTAASAWLVLAGIFALAILIGFINPAQAAGPVFDPGITPTKTLVCDMPVTREDGMALSVDEISRVDFYRSTDDATWTQAGTNTQCRLVIDMTTLVNGQYYYHVKAVDTDGRQSRASESIPFEVRRILPPSAPGNLRFE